MRLYPYQQDLVDKARPKLRDLGFLLLAAATRSGKTFAALTLAEDYDRVLIVTKANAKRGWTKYITNPNHVLISYGSLHKINAKERWDLIIADEVHICGRFPKPTLCKKKLKDRSRGARVLALSATPTIETICQIYHEQDLCEFGPFKEYKNFYHWFKTYGIPSPIWISGVERETYKKAKYDDIMKVISEHILSLDHEEAGFEVTPNVHLHAAEPTERLSKILDTLRRDKVLEHEGRKIIADTPVGSLLKEAMICGGSCYDVCDDAVTIHHDRAVWVADTFTEKRIVIFCQYLEEQEILKDVLEDYTSNYDTFAEGEARYFIGGRGWAEGVDFSFADILIMYTLPWSGTNYIQSIGRLCNKERTREAHVHVPIYAGTVEEKIWAAVSNKEKFNLQFYRKCK